MAGKEIGCTENTVSLRCTRTDQSPYENPLEIVEALKADIRNLFISPHR